MSKVTGLRIKYNDGTYSEEIPIKVYVENIDWDENSTLEDILGQLDIADGSVKDQLDLIVSQSKAAVQNGTDLSLVTTGEKYSWNDKGTVTGVTAGTGLSGGTVSRSGTIKANLNSETSLGTIGTTDKLYAIGIDENGKLCVSVPWTDTNTAEGVGAIPATAKGAASGVAELDENGRVPTSQLPSYVDDVMEYASMSYFPEIGEAGKIYVSTATNLTYRWTGSTYVEISPSLALGETEATAYRGDRGKIAYEHATDENKIDTAKTSGLYKVAVTKEGHIAGVTAVAKSDITNLGIPAQDTTYESKTAVQNGTNVSLVTTGQKYNWNNKVDKETGKGLSTNDYTTTEKNKLAGIATGAEVNVQADWNVTDSTSDAYIKNKPIIPEGAVTDPELSSTSNNPVRNSTIYAALQNKADKTGAVSSVDYNSTNKKITKTINGTTSDVVSVATLKTDLGSMPASDVSVWAKAANKPSYTAAEVGAIPTTAKGTASGVAELDATGKVPSSQLPSYVDDVIEYASTSSFPATGETGKIYIDTSSDVTYRWSGSGYVAIGSSLALGETSSTAYRGDRGKTAYDHATDTNKLTTAQTSGLYKMAVTSEGHIASVTAVQKSDITALGIPGEAASYSNLPAAQGGTDVSLVTTGEKYNWNNKTNTKSLTITLVATNWSNNTQSVSASGVTTSNDVIVSPVPAAIEDWQDGGIICTTQAENSLTFTCLETPENNISVNVLIIQ